MVGLRVIEKIPGLVSIALILTAGLILLLSMFPRPYVDPEVAVVLGSPGAMESFQHTGAGAASDSETKKPPLLKQAETLALYLNPPKPQTAAVPLSTPSPLLATPVVRPAVACPQFRLHATCCYPSCPERSRALISEPSDKQRRRWVKEGTQIGHFVIRQIKLGSVLCANGEQIEEVSIGHPPAPKGLVKKSEGGPAAPRLAREARDETADRNAVVVNANDIVLNSNAIVVDIPGDCDGNPQLPRE